jgi:hypothetical protein
VFSTTSIGERGGRLGPSRSRRRSALIAAACLALLTSLTATAADRHISQPASQGGRTSDHQLSSATQDGKTDEASSEILAVIAREGVISSFRLFLRVLPAVLCSLRGWFSRLLRVPRRGISIPP